MKCKYAGRNPLPPINLIIYSQCGHTYNINSYHCKNGKNPIQWSLNCVLLYNIEMWRKKKQQQWNYIIYQTQLNAYVSVIHATAVRLAYMRIWNRNMLFQFLLFFFFFWFVCCSCFYRMCNESTFVSERECWSCIL